MMTYREIWDTAYVCGAEAFEGYSEAFDLDPDTSSIRYAADRLIDCEQTLANRGLYSDPLIDALTGLAFRCGWADAEQAE